MWSIRTSARSSYEFTNNIEFTKPEGTKAFKIRIKGLPGGIPDAKVNDYPNPIKELGSLLAYFKTNALIYELAKVNGGSSANVYPKSASATVVINEDDFSKFESRMDKAIETFNKKYLKKYPDMTYTYEEVSLPEKVMTRDTLNDFIIVLYTLLNGVYQSDEATGLSSITSVGSIKCKDDTCVISAVGNSLSQTSMDEIDTTYYTTCGLSDINYQKTDSQRNWFGNVENPFYKDISDAFRKYSGGEMEFKDCISATNTSYVYKKNNKAGIVNISVNENKAERYTGTILTYLMNLPHTSDEN